MSLREVGAVTGVGETQYMRGTDRTPLSFQLEASLRAIEDAGLKPTDIDGVIPYGQGGAVAEDFITNFGIPDLRFSATTPMGGASAVASIQCAIDAIGAGICNHVLLSLGRTGYSGGRIGARVQQMPQFRLIGEFEMPSGAIALTQLYAVMARRHMELYGTTSRQFAEIAVTTRRHARSTPTPRCAIHHGEDHQASRMISDPLRLLDCSLESDGGAAVVISAADRARDTRHKPIVMGAAEAIRTRRAPSAPTRCSSARAGRSIATSSTPRRPARRATSISCRPTTTTRSSR
jgi:acetyl-CoA acetyltransferase